MDASPPANLVAKIPAGARRVLDVGCALGAAALRAAGVREIVGIAAGAAGGEEGYDRVLPGGLREPRDSTFDAILFAGFLARLEDPSDALVRVRPWLAPEGRVIASVPNVANWAVIGGLLDERFGDAPGSTFPGPALRYFTRSSLTDLFEACGYAVESIDGTAGDPSPSGRAFLAKLASLPGASPDLAVLHWVVVARAADGNYDRLA